MIKKITQSPYLNLFSGLILLLTSAHETIMTLDEAALGVHHGILVFSVIHLAQVIPEIMHGLSEIEESEELREEKAST